MNVARFHGPVEFSTWGSLRDLNGVCLEFLGSRIDMFIIHDELEGGWGREGCVGMERKPERKGGANMIRVVR